MSTITATIKFQLPAYYWRMRTPEERARVIARWEQRKLDRALPKREDAMKSRGRRL